jgi:hypothetical protein
VGGRTYKSLHFVTIDQSKPVNINALLKKPIAVPVHYVRSSHIRLRMGPFFRDYNMPLLNTIGSLIFPRYIPHFHYYVPLAVRRAKSAVIVQLQFVRDMRIFTDNIISLNNDCFIILDNLSQ